MRPAVLVVAALLAAPGDGERGPGPARPLAGLAGFSSTSRIVLLEAPDDPHMLQVVMAFPDRARWTMGREGTEDRRVEFLFGEHAFVLAPPERASEPLSGAELGAFRRRQALRRAAFLWPEGAAWEGSGERRAASIPPLEGDPPPAAVGCLEALLDGSGRPRSIESRDPAGRIEETLEIQGWSATGGRDWPARLRLIAEGEPVWEETVLAVEASTRLDSFFVPADRRQVLRPYAALERLRLPRAAALRLSLPPGADWDAARARAEEARRERTGELVRAGLGFDDRAWIVLSEDGLAPLAIELRLIEAPAALPQGFAERPARDGLRLALGGEAPPSAADRDRLRRAIGPGRRAEEWLAAVGRGEVQLDCVLAP